MERLYEGNITITVENTIANVILAYQNILFQTENVKLAEEVMNLSKDRYEQEEMKAELGTSVTYNLLQAKNADLQDQSSYLSAQSSYNNAVRQLNFLMAVDT
jgi:outer membrane protein